jgi:long-chain acyl-CoA synthetase
MFKRIYKSIHEKLTSKLIGPLIQTSRLALERVGWKNCKRAIFREIHENSALDPHLHCRGRCSGSACGQGLRDFGFNFVQGYGLTETSDLALNRPDAFKG